MWSVAGIPVTQQNHALVAVEFAFTSVAIVAVGLRVFTRTCLVKKTFGVDDCFVIVAALGSVGFLVGVMEQIRFGLGAPPNPKQLSPFIQASTASVISYTVCHLCVKMSISIQCLRIFGVGAARRVFIAFIVFLAVYGPLCLLLTIFVCLPVAKYWDDSIPGHCLDNRAMRYAFGGINIVNDIALLVAPMVFIRHLQIQKRVKILLAGLFAAGSVACIVSIIRLYSLWAYSAVPTSQRPVKGIDIAIWSGLECNIAILCACVPPLKQLYSRVFPGTLSNLGSSGHPTGDKYNSGGSKDNGVTSSDGPRMRVNLASGRRSGDQARGLFEMNAIGADTDGNSEENLVTKQDGQCVTSSHV